MMNLEPLVETYGYVVVLVWTLFEGETIVIVAGIVAYHGMLDPRGVALAAFAGSFAVDQTLFYLARRHAGNRLVRRVRRQPAFERGVALIERNATLFILSFRFLYGLRTIGAVALGLSKVPARKYLLLNAVAAAVWAVAFTAAGYVFGRTVEAFIGKLTAVEHKLLVAVAGGAVVYGLYRLGGLWMRRRRRRRG